MRPCFRPLILGGELATALLLIACKDPNCPPNAPCPTPTPLQTTCATVAGSRNIFWNDTCERSGSGVIVIAQSGCVFNASLTGLGTFAGTVSGSNLTFKLTFTDPCQGSATGTASVSGAAISGSYVGTESGGGSCCGAVNGTLTFQFAPTPAVTPTPTPHS